MVTISNFYEVEKKDGTKFISLELTGTAELIQSQNTGKWYATVRKCRIPSTFDANIAKTMIGQRLEGAVIKVICTPYDYVSPKTGEVIRLQHSYAYAPTNEAKDIVGITPIKELEEAF